MFSIWPIRSFRTPRARNILWAFAAWTAYGAASGAISYFALSGRPKPPTWSEALIAECSYAYLFALFSPFVMRLADRFRIEHPNRLRYIALHVLVSLGFATVAYVIWQVFMYGIGEYRDKLTLASELRAVVLGRRSRP
jgi:hypothetical protein